MEKAGECSALEFYVEHRALRDFLINIFDFCGSLIYMGDGFKLV